MTLHQTVQTAQHLNRPTAAGRLHQTPAVLLMSADFDRRTAIATSLSERGVTVVVALDELMVDDLVAQGAIDVLLIDAEVPGGDGLNLCRRLSLRRAPPLILFTPTQDETDRVIGLEVGADECLPQTCSVRELLAHIRALVRRARVDRELSASEFSTRFRFAGWRLCLRTRELRAPDGTPLFLAANELSLLRALVENPRDVLTRKHLRTLIGEDAADSRRMVDWRVHRLRAKLEKAGRGAWLIKTVPGRGYMFDAEVSCL